MTRIPLPPAPGADDHPSLALVNSAVSLPGGHVADDLGSPAEATAWLVGQRLVPEETALLAYCQGQLTTLRGNLRALFMARVEGAVPAPEALESVNRALVKVPSAPLLQFDATSGLRRVARHPVTQLVEHAMAQIAEDAAALLTGSQAELIAQCEATSCDRLLLRTHARRCWCSTRCGDRVRAARAYARKLERAQAG
ncbi:CGNR zinc finger domain-containing protein [Paeniglutamicibacter sp. MACA_103]|uniref:CGNR zinc finger domain-containing protein n=1 Tax=Paeniglutamicibacter sp. MACA_103 TaxID=3377337 RepID=UPI003893CC48